jgi:hypothetical protein
MLLVVIDYRRVGHGGSVEDGWSDRRVRFAWVQKSRGRKVIPTREMLAPRG